MQTRRKKCCKASKMLNAISNFHCFRFTVYCNVTQVIANSHVLSEISDARLSGQINAPNFDIFQRKQVAFEGFNVVLSTKPTEMFLNKLRSIIPREKAKRGYLDNHK